MGNEEKTELNAVATRLPDFAPNEPITWFRRTETRFRLRRITNEITKADYVLEALPETVFQRIGPWLDQQAEEVAYSDLKNHLLKEFSLTNAERAKRILEMPSQPMGDRKPSQVWNEICTLSRLPQVDETTKQHKEVDLKKEIWLQTLPCNIRASMHDTDQSVETLTKLADELAASQKAARFQSVLTSQIEDDTPDHIAQVRSKTPKTFFNATLDKEGICSYHKKFKESARKCIDGCKWAAKNAQGGRS